MATEKTLKTRIQLKTDTEANWDLATTFIPKKGEPIVVQLENGTSALKIGDGEKTVSELAYVTGSSTSSSVNLDFDTIAYKGQCTDPNTITESGLYYMTANTTNSPNASYGFMLANFFANGRGVQIATIYGASSNYWIRSHTTASTTWSNWRRIITADMFSYSSNILTITIP